MRKTALLLFVSMLAFASSLALARTVTITEFNNGGQVTVSPGDTVVVRLPASLGSGYMWNIAQNNSDILQLIDGPNMQGSGLPGSQTKIVYRFRAAGSGGVGLQMLYQRIGQGGVQAADKFFCLVVVDRRNSNETVYVGMANDDSQITLNVGDTLVVQLPANLSTGYSWNVASPLRGILQQQGAPAYTRNNKLMGGGGTQTFTFRVVGSGGGMLQMLYQKPSLGGGVPAANRFEIQLKVRRN